MAVIVAPGVQSSPPVPSADQLLSVLRGQLTLSDVADSPQDARYAVSSVDAANMPLLQGVQPVAGLPWPSSAGVTQFNGRTGAVSVGQLAGAGPNYTVGVSTAGSGVKIGDQRNLPPITAANYQSGWSGANITYTSTPTTATISVTAATLYYGNNSLNYNGSSVPVTGSAGTTVTFYLYYNDPDYSGGAQTLIASDNPHAVTTNDGYVNLGQIAVTFPTSGTGGGSGTGGCVSVDAWVIRVKNGHREFIRAGHVVVGDLLLLADMRTGKVTYSQRKQKPGVRIVAHDASALTCSTSAPIQKADGSVVNADDLQPEDYVSHLQAVSVRVVSVSKVGEIDVQHITCEHTFFWAGDTQRGLFAHHNMKPP